MSTPNITERRCETMLCSMYKIKLLLSTVHLTLYYLTDYIFILLCSTAYYITKKRKKVSGKKYFF